jgi:antirestriction protein
MSEYKIWIGDLACYNSGLLHGEWIDVTLDLIDIYDKIKDILESGYEWACKDDLGYSSIVGCHEEYEIMDTEGFSCDVQSIEHAHKLACFLDEYQDQYDENLLDKVLKETGGDIDQAIDMLDDKYIGSYESLADYARETTEGCYEIPDFISWYVDYERMGKELAYDLHTIETAYNEVHIFQD